MFHLKRLYTEKIKTWFKVLSSSGLEKNCTRFYHAPNIPFRGTNYRAPKWSLALGND